MKVGIAPLAVGVMVAAARLLGSDLTADVLGYVYLGIGTVMMTRGTTRGVISTVLARV
jgi:hypothetical protein